MGRGGTREGGGCILAVTQQGVYLCTCGMDEKEGREERFGDDAVATELAYLLVSQGDVMLQASAFDKGLGLEDAGVGYTEDEPLLGFISCFLTGILYRHPTFIC